MNFLLNGIKYNIIDSVISIISDGSACTYFEASQLMLAEHIHMLKEHSKFRNCNVLATYAACGKQPGVSDRGRGGRNVGGGHGSGAGMMNGEWDKRGIANGDHEFAVQKLNSIDNCWYPESKYQKMNPLEKRRFYLNQKRYNKFPDWSESKAPTSVNDVSITNYKFSEFSTSISILATHVKKQDDCLKLILSKKMAKI